ncbi:MAG: TIGR02584 family CRISPR-associated protein [Melioribacteraceae bacterium]|nr:TIGR02584 family CRISPR-associated protein [Melioribacteraceae bacterium]
MKNILIAISGLTPQVVTEALYEIYYKYDITIDEIFIVTTQRGKEVILGNDKAKSTPSRSLKTEIERLCYLYKLTIPVFAETEEHIIIAEEESVRLNDIRTDSENRLFPNILANLIKAKTSLKDTSLHCVLSGGRKSMTAHFALVLSLFARSNDKLYHVITDEKYEFSKFFPETNDEKKALTISEIPFVRLRSLNTEELSNNAVYTDLVDEAQERLLFLTDNKKLIINLADKTVAYGNNSVFFEPFEIVLYLKFAEQLIAKGCGYSILEITENKFASELKQILITKYNCFFDLKDKNHWSNSELAPEYFRSKRTKINDKLKTLFTESDSAANFIIQSQKIWGNSHYSIKTAKNKIGINYE